MSLDKRLTITDVAKALGVTPRTIMRWEKAKKIKKPKRDWRGWRFYHKEDMEEIKAFFESAYEYDDNNNGASENLARVVSTVALILAASLILSGIFMPDSALADTNPVRTPGVSETPTSIDINLDKLPVVTPLPTAHATGDSVTYTLGPNDVIAISVRRHPEFSGEYKINSEGMIEYKFVGDVSIEGLTKLELKEKLSKILSDFIVEPDIDIAIVAYLSKVFYIVGEVGNPGKFYMRGNTVSVREALFQAGLPTHAAAMRRCRLITPDNKGKENYIDVNVYRLLYEGDLKCNLEMRPGDVLYIPATVMAKIIRVISPVTGATGQAVGVASQGSAVAAGAL